MLREAFLNYSDANLTMIGLIIFVTFFIGLLLWVFNPFRKKHFERMRNLPFENDKEPESKNEKR